MRPRRKPASWRFDSNEEISMQLARQGNPSAETMNQSRALNARFIHNFVTHDVASHDAILHRDFNALIIVAHDVVAAVRVWRARARLRRDLAALSERELQDMGTCWSSIAHEVSKPFWRP